MNAVRGAIAQRNWGPAPETAILGRAAAGRPAPAPERAPLAGRYP